MKTEPVQVASEEKTEEQIAPESGVRRGQNAVYTLPFATDSIPIFLRGPLERIDPVLSGLQLVVITPDAESAIAMSEAVMNITGLGGIEMLPVTSAARARRLLAMRPIHAIAGPAPELHALVTTAHLKLEAVNTIVLAWVDDILRQSRSSIDALEALMAEVPRDAARVIVAREMSPEVEKIIERYARRARRETAASAGAEIAESGETAPLAIRYLTVSAASRPSALRRLLDEVDPPSAVVLTRTAASEFEVRQILRRLGYTRENDPVRISTAEIPAGTHTLMLYDAPVSADEIARAAQATPVQTFALVQPRELEFLRGAPGAQLSPYAAGDSVLRARASDTAMRDELKGVLENGILSRETVALEPLLEEYDAVEIAAAALRLLEQHRAARAAQPSAASSATPVRDRSAPSGDPTKTKLFMTIGEQDGVRAGDIVGAVAGETGLPGSVIGRIEIRDKHSLIEVDSEHAADVIRKMNGLQIRGRKIAVREERERPPRGDRPDRGERSTRGDRPDRGERRPDRGDRGDRRPPRRDAGERRPNRDDRGNRGERGDRPRSSDHRKRMP